MSTITNVISKLAFPTALHQTAAETIHRFFAASPHVDTVLVVNSCARGSATRDSDLDMVILVTAAASSDEFSALEQAWLRFWATNPALVEYLQSGRFTAIHLDLIAGKYSAVPWDDGGGPDFFEVEVGNHVAYSAVLGDSGPRYQQLRSTWLPYYDEPLRLSRLQMAYDGCANDLDHVPFFVGRTLYFQAFDRLYKAFQEFLQALFIARRVYPLAYNKWIRLQVEDWLGLPDVYRELPQILSVSQLESAELSQKAAQLRTLLDRWAHLP